MVLVTGYLVRIDPLSYPHFTLRHFHFSFLSPLSYLVFSALHPSFHHSHTSVFLFTVFCLCLICRHLSLSLFLACLFILSQFVPLLFHSLPPSCLYLCFWASGQYQSVFTSILIFPPLSIVPLHLSLTPVFSFSCGSLGSHALRLYLCLWERGRPRASD